MDRPAYCQTVSRAADLGQWRAVLQECERYEIVFIASKEVATLENLPLYSVHLCAYLIVNDLDNARFLWKRISVEIKQMDGELCQVWELGKAMWKREYANVYQLIHSLTWSPSLRVMIFVLQRSYQERVFDIICQAYSVITIERGVQLLGLPKDELKQFFLKKGWEQSGEIFTIKKQEKKASQTVALQQIEELTKYIVDIES